MIIKLSNIKGRVYNNFRYKIVDMDVIKMNF